MDRMNAYTDIVRDVVAGFFRQPSVKTMKSEFVNDSHGGHFEILRTGWQNGLRVHASVVHVDVRDGKVWIEQDGTDRPVAEELERAGIPKSDIVLAFHPPELRQYTGYAVG